MEFVILGWPADGPTLRLDHERFSYAGKFVMSNTGKAVVRADGDAVAAVAFNEDRTDADVCWLRYITVRNDRRGDGIGARLAAGIRSHLLDRDYGVVRIAVNNPFAYRALYKAGFCFTGRTTGLAELVLEAPCTPSPAEYRRGMDRFRDRDLSEAETELLASDRAERPPGQVEAPVLVEG